MEMELVRTLIRCHQMACFHQLLRLSRLASCEVGQRFSIHDAKVELEELHQLWHMAGTPAMHVCTPRS